MTNTGSRLIDTNGWSKRNETEQGKRTNGSPSRISADPLQTMNRPRSLAYKQTNLSYNAPYGSPDFINCLEEVVLDARNVSSYEPK